MALDGAEQPKSNNQNLLDEVRAAWYSGTPILSINTFDWQSTIEKLLCMIEGQPALRWDHVLGLKALNNPGEDVISSIGEGIEASRDPVAMLDLILQQTPDGTKVFMVNAHNYVADPAVSTGIGLCREIFKKNNRTLMLLGPEPVFPLELQQDVVLLRDPLPTDSELKELAEFVFKEGELGELTPALAEKMIAAGRGLSPFGFEQLMFMSIRRNKETKERFLDTEPLWAKKVEAVNAVPGLEMSVGPAKQQSRGLKGILSYFEGIKAGPDPIKAIVHIDEIDKSMAGAGSQGVGDSSGVSQEQLGVLLKRMEDDEWDGGMYVGPPGVGKSLISRLVAASLGVPYIYLDLGACKDSLVGESEKKIRFALEMINKIGSGRVFVNATCNRLDVIPPELRRRFTSGIWFFDLPDAEDRAEIWKLYKKKYSLKDPDPKSIDWTGAEIRNACRTAYRLGIPLSEAAEKYVTPVAMQDREGLNKLRSLANSKFLDASKGGVYHMAKFGATTSGARKVADDETLN